MKSTLFRPSYVPFLLQPKDLRSNITPSIRHTSTIFCSSRNQSYIPKLEPFSRTKFDRVVKDPPLIQKSEKEIADYCSTLEGEECCSCWQAYFELKDLEKESPKADIEGLILQTGGIKSLIGCLHGVAIMHKMKNNKFNLANNVKSESEAHRSYHKPDGLPKSADELIEEEEGRMADSPYTRLLRTMGSFPAWYSPTPDHETD
ncbi:hypothetical protein TanjilG_23102 [Lupinus angustifolius]|uniref:Maternal effect embryo arrest 14 n=1 Tax=Lupinus angustifolius TaxID=3871 RepID=A0A1J7FYQ3_LUPAN|nr:PREDICTED: CCG-binding protein 1-like isoform X1 [Lupinus angustifolius]XP_019424240.1 PREDICTED: CCG-binding protein 1-like isoform X2 [Lupinus angustifolius]OIV93261.1 hypothetical protein TanjilG_23102 [Lupinus angustifolius]